MNKSRYILIVFLFILCIPVLKAQKAVLGTKMKRSLFSLQLKEHQPSPVYRFVEQYMTDLQAIGNKKKAEEKMSGDKFNIEYGSLSAISSLNDSLDTQIVRHESKRYIITWQKKRKKIMSISFPIQYELILGMKKTELEDRLSQKLMAYGEHPTDRKIAPEDLIPTSLKNFFIEKKGFYQVESIRADHYYIKNKHGYKLLTDADNPIETIANLMTTGEIDNKIDIHFIQKKYGNKQDTFLLPLNQWIAFCLEEGCIPYFGVEEFDGKNMTATLVMENQSLGYIHLFFFTFPLRLLKEMKGTFKATLHAYIPTHNLENLFDDYNIKVQKRVPKYTLPHL